MAETLRIAAEEAVAGALLAARARYCGWLSGRRFPPGAESADSALVCEITGNLAAVEAALGNEAPARKLWQSIPLSHRTAAARRNLQRVHGGNGDDRQRGIGLSESQF